MFKILLILFISIPLIEIYLLIEIGSRLGAITTIMLILLTAMLGAFLLRLQGLATLARVKNSMNQGELPATALLEGLILLIAGALLLTPGFFTDIIGFCCLVPAIRSYIAGKLLKGFIETQTRQHQQHRGALEGEFWEDK